MQKPRQGISKPAKEKSQTQKAAYWMASFMEDPRKEKDRVVESRPVVAAG